MPAEIRDMILRDLLESIVPPDQAGLNAFKTQLRTLGSISHAFGQRNLAECLNQANRTLQKVMQPLIGSLIDTEQAAKAVLQKCKSLSDSDLDEMRAVIQRADCIISTRKDLRQIQEHILKCMDIIREESQFLAKWQLEPREVCLESQFLLLFQALDLRTSTLCTRKRSS